jgi:hypothetical protein
VHIYICIEASEKESEGEDTNNNNHTSQKTSATERLVILTTSALALPSPSPTVPRDLWTNKVEFLLSVIGYVVDLGMSKFKFQSIFFFLSYQVMFGDFLICVMTMVVVHFLFPT